nr:reverse transcriptase [Tanacetum cinerariifolium]
MTSNSRSSYASKNSGYYIYSLNSKTFRVFNNRTRIVEENLHIRFSESTPNVVESGPDWLFDIDVLTRLMNYEPIIVGTQSNDLAGTKANDNASQAKKEIKPVKDYILLPLWTADPPFSQDLKSSHDNRFKPLSNDRKKVDEDPSKGIECNDQEKEDNVNITNNVNTVSSTVKVTGRNEDNKLPFDPNMPALEDMDVKRVFLDGKIEEEVYVCQPPGYEDPDFPDRVYKVEKALYGLHQAPRAWYETLSTNLLDNGSQRGKIDKTLFIKRHKEVKNASTPMENQKPLLKDEDGEEVDVHMYRYQVKPKVSHIHSMKRFLGMTYYCHLKVNAARHNLLLFWSTSIAKAINGESQIHAWVDGKEIIITESSVRRDLRLADMEGVDCLPNSTIFENLELTGPKTTAWNEFSSTMTSVIICLATNQKFNFSKLIFNSMIRNLDNASGKFLMYRRVGKGFSGRITDLFLSLQVQNLMGEDSAIPTDPQHTPTILQPTSSQPKKTQKPRKPKRKKTQVPQPSGSIEHVADEVVYKELDDRLVRAATAASSLQAEHNSSNIDNTQSKATPNESSSPGTTLGGGPRCQEAIKDTIAQTRFANVSKLSKDSLLAREKTNTTQELKITSLKRRVKKLEKKQRSRTHKLKILYKVGLTTRMDSSEDDRSLDENASKQGRKIHDIDADEDITLVNDKDDSKMFDVNDLHGEDVFVEKEVAEKEISAVSEVNAASIVTTVSAAATITTNEITLAQALVEIKTSKPKAKGKRRKIFAAKEAEEKRNKPPTQAQQRKIMCTYLKNVERKKLKDLKNKSFDSIQKMFDRAFNRVNTFVDFRTKLVKGSSKRAREELIQESAKKKKTNNEKETTELKELMKIILDKEDVAIELYLWLLSLQRLLTERSIKRERRAIVKL